MVSVFNTNDVHPRDRFKYWNEVACKTFVEIECNSDMAGSFQGRIRSGSLSDISLSIVEAGQCNVRRTHEGIKRCHSEDVLLSLQLAGTSIVSQHGREAVLSKGDFAIYDAQAPYALSVSPAVQQLVLKLPRRNLERQIGQIARYAAIAVRAQSAMGAFASSYLSILPSLFCNAGDLNNHVRSDLSQQIQNLVGLTVRNSINGNAASLTATKALALARLKSVIDAKLFEPGLKPDDVSIAAGISTRYANLLLHSEGMSVEKFIRLRRLEICARNLLDPLQAGRSVTDIAFSCGFSDLSHFGRCFKAHFGSSPRDYRNARNELDEPAASPRHADVERLRPAQESCKAQLR